MGDNDHKIEKGKKLTEYDDFVGEWLNVEINGEGTETPEELERIKKVVKNKVNPEMIKTADGLSEDDSKPDE